MSGSILDGKGRGYKAEVNAEQALLCKSIEETQIAHNAHRYGTALGISTPMLTLTTTMGKMLYIRNNNELQDFRLDRLFVNWNGGSVNFNRPLYGQMSVGDTVPTGNQTAGQPFNLNTGKTIASNLDVYYWDEASTGMTGMTGGATGFYWCNGMGTTAYELRGAIILAPSTSMAFSFKGEEAGELSLNVLGYLQDSNT